MNRPQVSPPAASAPNALAPDPERAALERRFRALSGEVLAGELALLEQRRARLVELGLFEEGPASPPLAARPVAPSRRSPVHRHEPSTESVNRQAAEGSDLWCEDCGAAIIYAGLDASGRSVFQRLAKEPHHA